MNIITPLKSFTKKLLYVAMALSLVLIAAFGLYWHSISKKPVTLIYGEMPGGGRLGNQLWGIAHIYAYCLEMDYDLYIPGFNKEYSYLFEHFRGNYSRSAFAKNSNSFTENEKVNNFIASQYRTLCKHFLKKLPLFTTIAPTRFGTVPLLPNTDPTPALWHSSIPDSYQLLVNGLPQDQNSSIFNHPLPNGHYYIESWGFVWFDGIRKYANEIRELLKPHNDYVATIDKLWENVPKNRLIIGVHIRQTDFRVEAPSACFETSTYAEKMHKLYQQFKDKNPFFIVCSDEKQPESAFQGLDFIIANGQPIEDLYTLARCDVIIGNRVSTFSGWASWYGNVPKINMEDL